MGEEKFVNDGAFEKAAEGASCHVCGKPATHFVGIGNPNLNPHATMTPACNAHGFDFMRDAEFCFACRRDLRGHARAPLADGKRVSCRGCWRVLVSDRGVPFAEEALGLPLTLMPVEADATRICTIGSVLEEQLGLALQRIDRAATGDLPAEEAIALIRAELTAAEHAGVYQERPAEMPKGRVLIVTYEPDEIDGATFTMMAQGFAHAFKLDPTSGIVIAPAFLHLEDADEAAMKAAGWMRDPTHKALDEITEPGAAPAGTPIGSVQVVAGEIEKGAEDHRADCRFFGKKIFYKNCQGCGVKRVD